MKLRAVAPYIVMGLIGSALSVFLWVYAVRWACGL